MSDSSRNVITSVELSKSLDNDYSEIQLKKKIQQSKTIITNVYEIDVSNLNRSTPCIFLVGSKAEGISNILQSDWDIIHAENATICPKNGKRLAHESKEVLKLDRTETPAGYCFLYIYDTDTKISSLLEKLKFGSFSGPALSLSANFISDFFQDDFHKHLFSLLRSLSFDIVIALPCELPDLRTAWCDRPRKYDWPSSETIQHVATLPAHVVPVGLKGSENQDYQWRMCFTFAELHLIKSLNNIQTKVYVCLKTIAKYYLNPIDDTITSYIIKNVVLWLAESMPLEKFKPEFLIDRIEDSLRFLKKSVEDKCLRNYMIPERNLFVNKLENKEPLLEAINEILPLKLDRSEQIKSPEVIALYKYLCILENFIVFMLDQITVEQVQDVRRHTMTGGKTFDIELD